MARREVKSSVLRLEDVRAGDTAVAGGKGANLGELAANRFPVPPGFVVSARASRELFESLGLQPQLLALRARTWSSAAPDSSS